MLFTWEHLGVLLPKVGDFVDRPHRAHVPGDSAQSDFFLPAAFSMESFFAFLRLGILTTFQGGFPMGMHPRRLRAGTAYAQTQRTVDRQFLFMPDPVIRNIIGAAVGRAQQKAPVSIYWIEFNINHEQCGVAALSDSKEHLNNLVEWKRNFHRILAEEVNRHLGREGALFSSPPRMVECLDNESLEQQFFYAMTNPVKDGLVETVSEWKGFSSYPALAFGKRETFTYFDRTMWHKSGGKRKNLPLERFVKKVSIEYTPLPQHAELKPDARRAHIRREVRALENRFRHERETVGKTAMGAAALSRLDQRSRPKNAPDRTKKPLCHASSKERAQQYKEEFLIYLHAYRIASAAYRSGAHDAVFPDGAIRPPLIVVCGMGLT
jgi:hypothetical protein